MDGMFPTGSVLLNKYRVESVLGCGGMGSVFRVLHLQTGETLALKTMLPGLEVDPEMKARFLREAQAASRLRGEHVAKVTDSGTLPDGSPYMAMEYLHGVDLAEYLRRRLLRPAEVVDLILQACVGLAEAHANQIVHRDIKPSNLFLTVKPDGTSVVKILDFGISKAPIYSHGFEGTRSDLVMGTPAYMSPEQMKAAKDVDTRSDIWSLGVVLYEGFMGRRPFEADSFSAFVLKVSTESPPPIGSQIPRGLQSVVMRCLHKDRDARFPTMAALAASLAPFAWNRRAAALCVTRSKLFLRRRTGSQPARFGASAQASTMLDASVNPIAYTRYPRLLASTLLFVGAIALLAIAAVMVSRQWASAGSHSGERAPDVGSGEGNGSAGQSDADPATRATAAKAAEIAKAVRVCEDLRTNEDWRGLIECATTLERLGATDPSRELASVGRREYANKIAAQWVRVQLSGHQLKSVQDALLRFDKGSVYFQSLDRDLASAENAEIEAAVQVARSATRARDCAKLRPLIENARATSTERVSTVLTHLECPMKHKPAGKGGGLIDI